MHEDIDDFEPDWKSYYSMDDEERQARRDKYRLWKKYFDGKMTYERYLKEIDDPYFYSALDDKEWKEIKEIREKQKKKQKEEEALRKRKEAAEWDRRQKAKKENEQMFAFIFFAVMIIVFLIALLK